MSLQLRCTKQTLPGPFGSLLTNAGQSEIKYINPNLSDLSPNKKNHCQYRKGLWKSELHSLPFSVLDKILAIIFDFAPDAVLKLAESSDWSLDKDNPSRFWADTELRSSKSLL